MASSYQHSIVGLAYNTNERGLHGIDNGTVQGSRQPFERLTGMYQERIVQNVSPYVD